jgi:mRNA-degrading endonuclease toxin of MazEF toxin-antitoxin module
VKQGEIWQINLDPVIGAEIIVQAQQAIAKVIGTI